jgi:hypothetical protein
MAKVLTFPLEDNGAILSKDFLYRYKLTRRVNTGNDKIAWIMLNPSKADALLDDATIRRVCRFSRSWGFSLVEVYNLFAFRATNPANLWKVPDPIGPVNMEYLKAIPRDVRIVAAWGNVGASSAKRFGCYETWKTQVAEVKKLLTARGCVCLGLTRDGHPKHPLRLSAFTRCIDFLWGYEGDTTIASVY